jgi:hypothetical protein
MKKYLCLFLFCVTTLWVPAQDLNGFWKGTLTLEGGCFSVNYIELQIHIDGDSVSGDSYHYLDINNYVKKKFKGAYNASLKSILIKENEVTTFKIPATCSVCVKNYDLVYSKKGDKEYLSGSWNGKVMNTDNNCQPGEITLSRIKESAFKEVPEIKVDTGEIRLDFYDNGEIDGDSISILINKNLILSHQRLTAKPITAYVKIDLQNTFQEVEMVAENLGTIPPNTALLIITAGSKRYQLFLSSTEQKSARIRFVYDRDATAKPKEP